MVGREIPRPHLSVHVSILFPKKISLRTSRTYLCFSCTILILLLLPPKLKTELSQLLQNLFYFPYITQHYRMIFNIYFQKTGAIPSNKSNPDKIYFSLKAKTYSCSMYFRVLTPLCWSDQVFIFSHHSCLCIILYSYLQLFRYAILTCPLPFPFGYLM